MKNNSSSFLLFVFAVFMLLIYIPLLKEKTESVSRVTMTDSLGKHIILVDKNADNVVDVVVDQSRNFSVKRLPTEEEQKYFFDHKKQKTP